MRTQDEIYDLVSAAMYDAMHRAWKSLSTEERDTYKLNMHGLEMYVSAKRQPSRESVGAEEGAK